MTDESSTDQLEQPSTSTMSYLMVRAAFLPSLAFNLLMEKITTRQWFNRVDETVILGALPFPSMTEELVGQHKVRAVISMNEDYELRYLSNSPEDWSKSGVQFLQLSAVDFFDAPTQEKLLRGVKFIREFEGSGNSVYIHCKAGRTRSATLVGCYLMEKYQFNPDQAIEFMRSKRNHITLHPPHMLALKEFYENNITPVNEKDSQTTSNGHLKTEEKEV